MVFLLCAKRPFAITVCLSLWYHQMNDIKALLLLSWLLFVIIFIIIYYYFFWSNTIHSEVLCYCGFISIFATCSNVIQLCHENLELDCSLISTDPLRSARENILFLSLCVQIIVKMTMAWYFGQGYNLNSPLWINATIFKGKSPFRDNQWIDSSLDGWWFLISPVNLDLTILANEKQTLFWFGSQIS